MNNSTYLDRKAIRDEKLKVFLPDENGIHDQGIFGLPFGTQESEVVLTAVPWEATVSYSKGTSKGPKSIIDASKQIDLCDSINPNGWRYGIAFQEISTTISSKSEVVRKKFEVYLDQYFKGNVDIVMKKFINQECRKMCDFVKENTLDILNSGKIPGIVGGDHSVTLGALEAFSSKYSSFGMLQIDAHADMRREYEGLKYSHASIGFNALEIDNISKIVQVGLRDISLEELDRIKKSGQRVVPFTDYEIKKLLFSGNNWSFVCDLVVNELPEFVYISFDIDGLVQYLAPNTGTPVNGGLTLEEAVFLFEKVIDSGRKIIGFDLCEVSPGESSSEWDGNVGARVLYKLCLLSLRSKYGLALI